MLQEGKDYLICKICGSQLQSLKSHLFFKHKIPGNEYKKRFPGLKLDCEVMNIKKVETYTQTCLEKYGVKSPSSLPHRRKQTAEAARQMWLDRTEEETQALQKKKRATCFERYGVENTFQNPGFEIHERGREALFKKYGVTNASQIEGVGEKIHKKRQATLMKRYGVLEPMLCPELKDRALRGRNNRPTSIEIKLATLLPDFVKYTGNAKFWVTFKSGVCKNPDFVVRPFRKWKAVIEIFGSYFHKPEEQEPLIASYAELGIRCLVLWDYDLKDEAQVQKRFKDFLTLCSSETTRETLST